MEYLSGKPFSVGGHSRAYSDHYDQVFCRPRPITLTRLAAAGGEDGHEGTLGSPEEEVAQGQAQGALLPLPPVEEAREAQPEPKQQATR